MTFGSLLSDNGGPEAPCFPCRWYCNQEPLIEEKDRCKIEVRGWWWVPLFWPCQLHDLWSLKKVLHSRLQAIRNVWEEFFVYSWRTSFYRLRKYELVVTGGATKDESWSPVEHRWPWMKSICQLGDALILSYDLSKLSLGSQNQGGAMEWD